MIENQGSMTMCQCPHNGHMLWVIKTATKEGFLKHWEITSYSHHQQNQPYTYWSHCQQLEPEHKGVSQKRFFQKQKKWRNPARISMGVSLKGSKRFLILTKVGVRDVLETSKVCALAATLARAWTGTADRSMFFTLSLVSWRLETSSIPSHMVFIC